MNFNLIQNAFSTILLDSIQYFPQDLKKHAETHGLLFGLENHNTTECDYVFPVGNVKGRTKDSITPNRSIDHAIQTAKELISTSKNFGTYHSHPNTHQFSVWAEPSNADVSYAKYLKLPFMIILAITRNSDIEKPLDIWYSNYERAEFYYDKKAGDHDAPRMEKIEGIGQSICGEFKKYTFEMRGYHFNGKSLSDVKLYSSEAEMLMELNDQKIDISSLSSNSAYSLRKIEYNLRLNNKSERSINNLDYHLDKIKNDPKIKI